MSLVSGDSPSGPNPNGGNPQRDELIRLQIESAETDLLSTKPQEAVQFYPTFGSYDPVDGHWKLRVAGRVIKPRADSMRRKLILRVIRQVLNASSHQLNSPIFQDRVRGFLMMTKRGRRIRVGLGQFHFRLEKRTDNNGEFRASVTLTPNELASLAEPETPQDYPWINLRSRSTKKIHSSHLGRVQVIPPHGLSVITDIDDTIKATNVLDRGELLANTFFEPFKAVEGMSQLFDSWSSQQVAFHYVSSSPWQLYAPLAAFMHENGFPAGSFHLRSIRFRDPSILQLVVGRKRSKKQAIKQILRSFPERRFLLVGDVGEKDPEIYGAIARKYPKQIDQVCLRRLPGGRIDARRFARAFRKVPIAKWRIFDTADELNSLIPTANSGWHDKTL